MNQNIFVFTLVTIIYLPLTFVTVSRPAMWFAYARCWNAGSTVNQLPRIVW